MTKKVILAGVLGGVAMFAWSTIAHMALPLGEAGIRQIDNEQPLLAQMKSVLGDHGIYMFPRMTPGSDTSQYQQSIAAGPSGLLVYFPRRDFNFGKSLGLEFLTELAEAIIAAYLLSLAAIGSFAGRLGFYALVGLIAVVGTNVSYWNWYGFPATYTLAYMFTGWAGYLSAGLVGAAIMREPGRTRLAVAA